MDRLARQLEGRARFVRVNVATATGIAIARKYGVSATPTLLVFDRGGKVTYSQVGLPSSSAVLQAVQQAGESP